MPPRQPSLSPTAGHVVELAVCGRDLRDMDLLSRSDAFVVLFVRAPTWHTNAPRCNPARVPACADTSPVVSTNSAKTTHTTTETNADTSTIKDMVADPGTWQYYGETEIVWDSLSPKFATRLFVPDPKHGDDSHDGVDLHFEVYDADTTDQAIPLSKHHFIGALSVTLTAVLQAGTLTATLQDKKMKPRVKLGTLIVSTERYFLPSASRPLSLRVSFARGVELPRGATFFYVLARETKTPIPNGELHVVRVYRSGCVKPAVDAALVDQVTFQDVSLPGLLTVDAADEHRMLVFELYLHRGNGAHVLAGRSEPFCVNALKIGRNEGLYCMRGVPGPGTLRGGDVCIRAQIIPEPQRKNDSLSLGPQRALRNVGTAPLNLTTEHFILCQFTRLLWTPKSSIRDVLRL
jgi:hypothetical protein